MVTSLVNNKARPNDSESIKKLLFVLSGIFLFIISLTIFQDFLESKRNGYMFYVSESLLFKTIWVLFIPIIAILYKRLKKDSIAISESRPTPNTFVVNNGKDNVVVTVENIIQITSATPYIFIHLENNKYLHSETLKSICGRFDNNVFVRVHKSTVVNISKVSSFKSRLNGDYDLELENGELVRLSRTYAPDFKKRFNGR